MAEDMIEADPVKGVVMIFISDDGRPVCEATDFEPDKFGGFTLKESQKIRCKGALARAILNAYASPALVRAIDTYRGEEIMRELTRMHGCKVKTVFIGHERERYDEDV